MRCDSASHRDSLAYCHYPSEAGDVHDVWSLAFPSSARDPYINSIYIVLPVHDALLESDRMLMQVLTETTSSSVDALFDTRLWVGVDPPTYVPFKNIGILDMTTVLGGSRLLSLTGSVEQSNVAVSVDVAKNSDIFASDRGHRYHFLANEHVLQTRLDDSVDGLEVERCTRHDQGDDQQLFNACLEDDVAAGANQSRYGEPVDQAVAMSYVIKVLAFNRPSSLKRLLTSLHAAEYLNLSVPLEIIVDGNRTADEGLLVSGVVELAESFQWLHGPKR